ncbi:hypothetical protein GCM10022284_26610 [Streptomyces hundungensis]
MATITAAGAVRAAVSTVTDTFLVRGGDARGANPPPHKVTGSCEPPVPPGRDDRVTPGSAVTA